MPSPETISISKIKVPLPLLFGKYELLSSEELRDLMQDILVELDRREQDAS